MLNIESHFTFAPPCIYIYTYTYIYIIPIIANLTEEPRIRINIIKSPNSGFFNNPRDSRSRQLEVILITFSQAHHSGRTLEEGSARRTDLSLTTYKTNKRMTSTLRAGFKPAAIGRRPSPAFKLLNCLQPFRAHISAHILAYIKTQCESILKLQG